MRGPGFIRRNWRLKVGSVLIAFVTWIGVVYAGNPPETRLVSVPVPASAVSIPSGYVLLRPIGDVLVRVGGEQNTLDALNPAVLQLHVLSSAITHAGTYSIPMSVTTSDVNIDLIDPPTSLQVDVDVFKSVSVPVNIFETTPPPVGYHTGSQQVSPSQVAVEGPLGELTGVQARVSVVLGAQKANYQATLQVYAYGANNQRLNNVHVIPPVVSVSIALIADGTTSTVAVLAHIEGNPPPGHFLISVVCNPPSVVIAGPQDLLNSLESIPTLPIFLNGVTGFYTQVINLAPPPGVTVSQKQVTVTLDVGTLPTPTPIPTPTPPPSPSPT